MSQKLSSAAVVIGAKRCSSYVHFIWYRYQIDLLVGSWHGRAWPNVDIKITAYTKAYLR